MNNIKLPKDVWEAARLIWENTIAITDRELIEQLEVAFGDKAPKSSGTISKRRKKESWQKNNLVQSPKSGAKTTKKGSKQEASEGGSRQSRKQNAQKNSLIPSKTNKAQNREASPSLEAKKDKIDDISDSVVVDAAARAKIIKKYRKRYFNLGEVFDQALEVTLSIKGLVDDAARIENEVLESRYGANFEIGENAPDSKDEVAEVELANERVKQAMVLSKALTDTTTGLAMALKMISEVDMPMLGITADDFKQSEQDRRLGALAALGNIDDEERKARERLLPELHERLKDVIELESSADFGLDYDDDDNEAEDIDYTTVDD